MAKKILFQGDSITDVGRSRDNIADLGKGYPHLIKGQLGAEFPLEYEFINKGVSGNRIVDLYARIKIDFINLAPDYASIYIGVNDAWHEIGSKTALIPLNSRKFTQCCLTKFMRLCPILS